MTFSGLTQLGFDQLGFWVEGYTKERGRQSVRTGGKSRARGEGLCRVHMCETLGSASSVSKHRKTDTQTQTAVFEDRGKERAGPSVLPGGQSVSC